MHTEGRSVLFKMVLVLYSDVSELKLDFHILFTKEFSHCFQI